MLRPFVSVVPYSGGTIVLPGRYKSANPVFRYDQQAKTLLDMTRLTQNDFSFLNAPSTQKIISFVETTTSFRHTMTETEVMIPILAKPIDLTEEVLIDSSGNEFDESLEARAMIVDFAIARKRRRGCKRVVSFYLVAEVRERPRTEQSEISSLFYSAADIKEFRREYREMVRRRMDEQRPQSISGASTVVSTTVSNFMKSATQLVKSIAGEAGILSQEGSEPNIFVDTLYLF
jgi:hypothetical protein